MKTITLDKKGRFVLPAKFRKHLKTRKFILKAEDERIVLEPVKKIEDAFGFIPEINLQLHKTEHEKER